MVIIVLSMIMERVFVNFKEIVCIWKMYGIWGIKIGIFLLSSVLILFWNFLV